MTTVSLDAVIRNFIMKRGYTFHWYIQFAVYASECLRELSMDDLHVVNTVKLPVDQDTNEATIPDDYQDYVKVGVQAGQYVRPLIETQGLNQLQARTSDFTPTTYGQLTTDNPQNIIYYGTLYPFYWNTVAWNDYGEPTGRFFGLGAGSQDDTFTVIKSRNVIKVTENLSTDHIILQYIGDGTSSDAATQIDPYAFMTISNYIMYQMKENSRTYSDNEAERARQLYINERLILRARLNGLTTEVFKRAMQKGTAAAPKSL